MNAGEGTLSQPPHPSSLRLLLLVATINSFLDCEIQELTGWFLWRWEKSGNLGLEYDYIHRQRACEFAEGKKQDFVSTQKLPELLASRNSLLGGNYCSCVSYNSLGFVVSLLGLHWSESLNTIESFNIDVTFRTVTSTMSNGSLLVKPNIVWFWYRLYCIMEHLDICSCTRAQHYCLINSTPSSSDCCSRLKSFILTIATNDCLVKRKSLIILQLKIGLDVKNLSSLELPRKDETNVPWYPRAACFLYPMFSQRHWYPHRPNSGIKWKKSEGTLHRPRTDPKVFKDLIPRWNPEIDHMKTVVKVLDIVRPQ
jgi:hypothetical protein